MTMTLDEPKTATRLVFLAGYPRSGNTLVRHVLESLYGVKTRTFYPNEGNVGLWPDRQWKPGLPGVQFVKTHETNIHPHLPAIHIVRDGRDALVSHACFFRDVGGATDDLRGILRDLIEGRTLTMPDNPAAGVWDWSASVLAARERTGPFAELRFEDLLRPSAAERLVAAAVEKVGVTMRVRPNRRPIPSFAELHHGNPTFYRRGTVGQWRAVFDDSLNDLFWSRNGEAMERLGYEFSWR